MILSGVTFYLIALLLPLQAVEQTATISMTSDPPGAAVYVDGTLVGVAPVTIERPPGPHRVRVAKTGYLENVRVIEFSAGEPAAIQVTLTPDSTGTAAAPWFKQRKWILVGAAGGGGAAAAVMLSQREGPPPIAGTIAVSPATGLQSGTAIMFASQGASVKSGEALQYAWEFGDGATGSGPLVSHVYSEAGAFTPRVTVTAAKKTAVATGSVVVIRSVSGTWRGTLAGVDVTLVLTQTGANITGTYREPAATGTVAGPVQTTSPRLNLTITTPAFSASFTGDPNETVDVLTGTYREQGLTLGLTLTRQ